MPKVAQELHWELSISRKISREFGFTNNFVDCITNVFTIVKILAITTLCSYLKCHERETVFLISRKVFFANFERLNVSWIMNSKCHNISPWFKTNFSFIFKTSKYLLLDFRASNLKLEFIIHKIILWRGSISLRLKFSFLGGESVMSFHKRWWSHQALLLHDDKWLLFWWDQSQLGSLLFQN